MRILIATGIFTPEVGGPATYAPKLAAKLVEKGHKVTVVAYSDTDTYPTDDEQKYEVVRVRRGSRPAQMYRFYKAVMQEARDCDVIYTLDWLASGLPVMYASRKLGKKYIVRIGGDYAWDVKYLDSGSEPMSLADFYARGVYKRKYRLMFWLIHKVLFRAAHVVFNTEIQRKLYLKYYGLVPERTSVISNPVPLMYWNDVSRGAPSKEIVYMGRFVEMKNVSALVRAFAKAKIPKDFTLLLIGDGPQKEKLEELVKKLGIETRTSFVHSLPQHELFLRVKDCRAAVLPSWTDISPNSVYEALAIGLPTLVTKENYLGVHDQLPSMIDPNSDDDIAQKLEMLADDNKYQAFTATFAAVSFAYSWDDATRDHLNLFEKVSGIPVKKY